ncbi:methionine synthase [Luedemannella flava]|uniref:Methionine synthase n=1 Tax=Luedemannella flava TaxID=349316 RepID=A0ABP4XSL0_9ACTN
MGSLPGTDIREAVRVVLGELPDLPHLPELPGRGPGADLIGRTAGLLIELPVELYAGRWRVAAHPGRDLLRTHDLRERDLDALMELADGYTGVVKVQAAGPWTLAASVELPIGGRVLRDHGAARDVCESLAEGLAVHVAEVSRRLPGASVLLQLDEPSLPAVLAGTVPTESGWQTLRAVPEAVVRDSVRSLVDAVGVPVVVHSCAPDVPVRLLREAGVTGVGLDVSLLTDLDPLGEALDAGLGLFAGAAPTVLPAGRRAPTSAQVADKVRDLWHKLGFPAARLPAQVVVTPACGLAGATAAYARDVLRACRDAGRRLAEV